MEKYKFSLKNSSYLQFFMIIHATSENLALINAKLIEKSPELHLPYLSACNTCVPKALNRFLFTSIFNLKCALLLPEVESKYELY